jgi:hypothetical protein
MGWPLILHYCVSAHYAREDGENVIDLLMPIAEKPTDRESPF